MFYQQVAIFAKQIRSYSHLILDPESAFSEWRLDRKKISVETPFEAFKQFFRSRRHSRPLTNSFKNFLSKSFCIFHEIQSHGHLFLHPESAYDDDFGGGFATMQIQDPGSGGCGCGFYAKYENFWPEVLTFDKN